MKVTVATADDRIVTVDVDEGELVENVKAILEVELQIPLGQQQLMFQGAPLLNSTAVGDAGVKDGDLLLVLPVEAPSRAPQSSGRPAEEVARRLPDGSAADPRALLGAMRSNAGLMANLRATDPRMAAIIDGNDVDTFQEMLRAQQRRQQADNDLLFADPFDVDAQRKIEEAIRQKNVDENYEMALEHSPEVFTSVTMLYVPMEVNNHPIKAFVDSGAQMTNMSRDCAERCGLMRLVDRRFGGVAIGVGESVIIGRIHAVQLKIGRMFYTCSITVLEKLGQGMLFGLDMLRKHACVIDLEKNVLRVGRGEVEIPFLPEHECPKPGDLDMPLRGATIPTAEETAGPSAPGGASQGTPAPGEQRQQNPPPPQQPSGPAGSRSEAAAPSGSEEKILRLVELGFSREQVIGALSACDGNEDQAAGILFG